MNISDTLQELSMLLRREESGMAKKLHRGMQAIATVAKLYRKYHIPSGQTPVFRVIKPTDSPKRQAARLAQNQVQVGQFKCRRCDKLFIGPDRCQCKAVVMKRKV